MTDPQAAAPPFERLDPRVVVYWLVSGLLGWAVLAALLAGGWLWLREAKPDWEAGSKLAAIAGASMLLAWTLAAPGLSFWRWRFAIGGHLLVLRHGIVFHEEKAIPVSRLQHVDLTRGPIERLFGLATLVVFTAGTEAASFRVPGLAAARAAALRDRILQVRGDDVV
jgi:hypothetical protein